MLRPKRNSIKNNTQVLNLADYLCDKDCGLYLEEHFANMLYLERKRSERSKKPFLLLLVNIGNDIDNADKNQIVKQIAPLLFSITRETDIKGWFQYNHTIGVIFTEINGVDKKSLKQKMANYLMNTLKKDHFNKVQVSFYFFPEENNEIDKQNSPPNLKFYPEILKKESSNKIHLLIKRIMDVLGSIIGLIIFSPFFLLVPLFIKITSKGPVFFKQERIGRFGKKFTFLKFRTMYIDNDPNIHKEYIKKFICEQKSYIDQNGDGLQWNVFKIADDSRITPLGKFLRRSSIDEFPQFINVLKGEMSLVGPRPPIPYELENYDIWHKRRILEIKPGLTGPWQVWGRSSTTFDEMVRMEIRYIKEWSLWLDMKIILLTPWAVLIARGAY